MEAGGGGCKGAVRGCKGSVQGCKGAVQGCKGTVRRGKGAVETFCIHGGRRCHFLGSDRPGFAALNDIPKTREREKGYKTRAKVVPTPCFG